MARAATSLGLFSLLVLLMSPLLTASPFLSGLWPANGEELTACSRNWYSFQSLCWTPVPLPLTSFDEADADLFCEELNARALQLEDLHVCVKDAEEIDDRAIEDLLRSELSIKHKRIMGNNGY